MPDYFATNIISRWEGFSLYNICRNPIDPNNGSLRLVLIQKERKITLIICHGSEY